MNFSFPAFTEEEDENALTPFGWRQNLYKLNEGAIRFRRRRLLAQGDDYAIESFDLEEGVLRIGGEVEPNRLFIAFIESENMRLLGARAGGRALSLSFDGGPWNLIATGPTRSVALCVGADALRRILSAPVVDRLRGRMFDALWPRSLATTSSPQAEALQAALADGLELARKGYAPSQETRQLLFEMTARLIEECAAHEPLPTTRGELARHRLALEIEKALWRADKADLNSVIERTEVSRRKVQLAVEEHFGTSFTDLSRLIRLHKVRREMLTRACAGENIADLARRFGFEHYGRFSQYYRSFFGVAPLKDKKLILSRQRETQPAASAHSAAAATNP